MTYYDDDMEFSMRGEMDDVEDFVMERPAKPTKTGFSGWVEQQGGWGPVLITVLIAVGTFVLVWWLASLSSAGLSASSGNPVAPVGSIGASTASFTTSSTQPVPPPTSTGTGAAPASFGAYNRNCAQRGGCGCAGQAGQNSFANKSRSPALVTDAFGQTSPDGSSVPVWAQSR